MILLEGSSVSETSFINNNRFSVLLILAGLVVVGVGLVFPKIQSLDFWKPQAELSKATLVVDLGGAVKSPGVYEIKPDESKEVRVEDIIKKAGGFTTEADLDWVTKNLNLAALLKDEMKIYIPKKGELGVNSSSLKNSSTTVLGVTNLVNINTATEAELDKLPGVGPATSKKIIDGRPYNSLDELQNKKVIPNSTFEKIKTLIRLQ